MNFYRVINKTRDCLFACIVIFILSIVITGCSGGDAPPPTQITPAAASGSGSSTPPTPNSGANTIALSLSQNSVLSDGFDSSTITATVIKDNIPQDGVTVDFATTVGLISSGSEISDVNGETTITFSANPGNPANQTATITATSAGISQSIPIIVSGTTITLTPGKSSLSTGEKTTLSIEVKDAGGTGIHDATVALSTSNTNVTLSATTGTTTTGTMEVDISGTAEGTTEITVISMGATQTITIEVLPVSTVINITSPATSPTIIETNTPKTVTVTGPESTQVRFVTSLGLWDNNSTTKEDIIVGGTASADLTSSDVGTATVQVSDITNAGNTDITFINVSPPATDASKVAISFSSTTMPPSSDSISNSVTVYAKVITATSEPIANVQVTFSLSNTTGGGEYINPPQATTNSSGYAITTFYSGTSSSSGLGVNVTATEQGSGSLNSASDSIIIGGVAASISLTASTKVNSIADNTAYQLPMSVLVSDSSGAAIENAVVSLSSWPTSYALGYIDEAAITYQTIPGAGPYSGWESMPNEDTNRNLVLDPGEDIGPCNYGCTDLAADDALTPASSAAGTVPSTVTTLDNGIAEFDLTYLKLSALWVESEITATVRVMGTESKTSLTFWLPYLLGEEDSLYNSPYGYY